ncbi:MAG: ABC transporter substrate-binding protein [Haloarculaceae archaeon]
MSDRWTSRRKYVKLAGLAGLSSLAGCASSGDGEDGGDGGDGTESGQTTATEEPAEDGGDGGMTTTETMEDGGDGGGEYPDVLQVVGYPASGIQIFRNYYSNYSPEDTDLLLTDGLQDADMQQQVGNPMENALGTAPKGAGPNRDAFASLYQDEYGETPSIFNAHTFDAVAILALANVAAGENSGPAIKDQMRNVANGEGMEVGPGNIVEGINAAAQGQAVNYSGASSPTDFDERGDPAAATYGVWEFAPDTESGVETVQSLNFTGNPGGASADSIPGGTGRTAKVGLILPETGDLASVGKPMIQAGELAAMVINRGDPDVEVDLQFQDTQTSPQAGIQAANSLINAGYACIAGPASSGVNVPTSKQAFIPNEVVSCSPSSTALSVSFLEDNDYVYRTAPSDLLQGQVQAQVASETLGATTTSTMFVNNDYGQQLAGQYTDSFTSEHSGSVWKETPFQKEQSSYTAVLSEALSES